MGHEQEWERYVKYLFLLNYQLFSTFSMKKNNHLFHPTLFWSKWLKWKGRRQARLSNSISFEQDLIFLVAEWQWYVKYLFLLNFRLFSSFSMKQKSSFYSCFYLTIFCVFILLCYDQNGWNKKVKDRQDSQTAEALNKIWYFWLPNDNSI